MFPGACLGFRLGFFSTLYFSIGSGNWYKWIYIYIYTGTAGFGDVRCNLLLICCCIYHSIVYLKEFPLFCFQN